MQYSRKLYISMAGSRKASHWPKAVVLWSEFIDRLRTPVRSGELLQEYLSYPKARQDELKDVGGFVGGTFSGDRRKAACVEGRDLITLDLDNIPVGKTEDILKRVKALGCAAAVYSTRKHSGYTPRLRVIVPVDRTCTADEYEPAARKLASLLGIEFCDPTTFEAFRMMYWPSCCRDSQYICEAYDNPFCSVDGLLEMYGDWTDVRQWPQVPGADAAERRRLAKQEDPTKKKGVIGAFCRTYSVIEAMETFIQGMYEETDTPGRYTYTGGSTVGGAVVYDRDLFLYSHHATDPCSGLLVNAFDLVRLHRFGDMDAEAKEGTPVSKMPSFLAMSRLALDDDRVSSLMAKERHEQAQETFAVPGAAIDTVRDLDWLSGLSVDGNGNYQKTVNNMILILQNDPALKGKIATDEFAGRGMLLGDVPWDPSASKRAWRDDDDAGLFWYLENYYHLAQQERQDKALAIVGRQNLINDVKRYLQSLSWDGKRRVDTLLSVYLGADDTRYTRAVIRKFLCAAAARAVVGGVKFDYMSILTGPQGIGKSSFLGILGGEWFNDSLTSFEGKDAAELLQGSWIVEVGELTAMSKQETNAVKQFLSKRDDIYRAPYGKRTERHPRRCVLGGTSNNREFLKDETGNRRFWPVDVGVRPVMKSVWRDLPGERDQVWAEAYWYWMLGEPLYLPKDVEQMAAEQQEGHKEDSVKRGMILEFLERLVPCDWDHRSLEDRRLFLSGVPHGKMDLVHRDRVCALEIWMECFGGDPKFMKRSDSAEINGILSGTSGWRKIGSPRKFGPYGSQRGFERATL